MRNCTTSYDAISSSMDVFVPFILITSFAVLNLFIGIIVDAMQRFDDDANGQDPSKNVPQQDNTIEEIQALKTEIQELKQLIQKINTDKGELHSGLK